MAAPQELFPTAETKPGRSGLAAKLCAIMGELPRIVPGGVKAGQSQKGAAFQYPVFEEADIVDPVRLALLRHRVLIVPDTILYEEKAGIVFVRTEYTLIDGDSGEMLRGSAVGAAKETDGSAAARAATDCLKTFIRKLFLIATGKAPRTRAAAQPGAAAAAKPAQTAKWPRKITSVRKAGSEKSPYFFATLVDSENKAVEILCCKPELFAALQQSVGRSVTAEVSTDQHSKYPRLVGLGAN